MALWPQESQAQIVRGGHHALSQDCRCPEWDHAADETNWPSDWRSRGLAHSVIICHLPITQQMEKFPAKLANTRDKVWIKKTLTHKANNEKTFWNPYNKAIQRITGVRIIPARTYQPACGSQQFRENQHSGGHIRLLPSPWPVVNIAWHREIKSSRIPMLDALKWLFPQSADSGPELRFGRLSVAITWNKR